MSSLALPLQSNESELVERVRAGDRESFYELVQPYERAIFSTAMCVLRNEADAAEVCQESVLRALSALPRFRGECKFSTWLLQITINESRARLRKDRRRLYESICDRRTGEEAERSPKDFPDWREIPSEELQRKELRVALKRALDSLAPRYREVLVLRDIQRLSTQQTSQILRIGEGCVKTRLARARSQMRNALAPEIDRSWMSGRAEFAKIRPFVE
jgi:RNA polymerase sigma-70 factor, ECF subfamily